MNQEAPGMWPTGPSTQIVAPDPAAARRVSAGTNTTETLPPLPRAPAASPLAAALPQSVSAAEVLREGAKRWGEWLPGGATQ